MTVGYYFTVEKIVLPVGGKVPPKKEWFVIGDASTVNAGRVHEPPTCHCFILGLHSTAYYF